jgi:dienelactone hydrolase
VLGGSKGGELVLALASYYPDIDAVVSIVAGDAAFPGHTAAMTTSSWSLHGEPLPFVPMRWSAVPALLRRDLRPGVRADVGGRAAEDDVTPPPRSQAYATALRERGIGVSLEVVPGLGHNILFAPPAFEALADVLATLSSSTAPVSESDSR